MAATASSGQGGGDDRSPASPPPPSRRLPRALVTGCTLAQIRTPVSIPGYKIDQSAVAPGEDVRKYAAAFVQLSDPYRIAAAAGPFLHGALWVLSQRSDAVIIADDLHAFTLPWIQDPEYVFRMYDHEPSIRDKIMETIHALGKENIIWRMVKNVSLLGD